MRDVDHRSSSHRSRHKSRSISRDRDRDRDNYSRRRRRSKSRSRTSKSKKKKSKKKRYRRSSSSSTTTSSRSSKTSSRSRGSMRSSGSSFRHKTQTTSTEKYSSSNNKNNKATKKVDLELPSSVPDKSTLDKIEEDTFTAKPFISTAENKKIPEKVIIDLKNDTISVEIKEGSPEKPQIIHPDFLGDPAQKLDKWVKKLYNYRQKAFQE